jgi:predicted DNA-binding transcriptional regulator AlpA
MDNLPPSRALEPDEPPFRLESPPNELWALDRIREEFGGVSKTTIYDWIRAGRLPRPWVHRGGRSLWAPELVRPALDRWKRRHSE